ncbi:efflux transporter outer membrane subunit [Sphingomonas sp. PL-96]|uniref:efflux transporter outer membrane subunit n=1 Tax=Sphingomonas sp. PL-96 TaxID=2887201 RepID=UPI001E4DC97F|nr:efflux transporter outer membrane subunit [Sphingomonas sp. PL-96]MCC2976574.1 efflux transporter outer membrane subunit [Sphingomonas sp. PL-96]
MTHRLIFLAPVLLAGCAVGPDYVRPTAATPPSFKTAPGWTAATPSDRIDRGKWWQLFGDATLSSLSERALAANQTIAQAAATYAQARAATREQRASLFPAVDLSGSGVRSGGGSRNRVTTVASGGSSGDGTGSGTGTGTTVSTGTSSNSTYQVAIGASWEPDLFGRIRRTVENAEATAEARRADLASSQLSILGELATNYFNLRAADAEITLVQETIAGYERALRIATNRYNAGIVARTDVFQAQSQLATTRSELEGLQRNRRTYENAIAVLVGEPASSFTLAAAQWTPTVPAVPTGVPSGILQRRPDIAAQERAVAAANAEIGVEQSAFFPTVTLSSEGGVQASGIGSLFSSSATLWSLGASVAQTLFDAGARSARVRQARAAYDAAVASYRETVLEAFQDVEDQLTAAQILARQELLLREAATAATRTEAATLNQYQEGLITFTDVVTAQATALNARRSLLQASVDRQTAAVALVQALGGAWDGEGYPLLATPQATERNGA